MLRVASTFNFVEKSGQLLHVISRADIETCHCSIPSKTIPQRSKDTPSYISIYTSISSSIKIHQSEEETKDGSSPSRGVKTGEEEEQEELSLSLEEKQKGRGIKRQRYKLERDLLNDLEELGLNRAYNPLGTLNVKEFDVVVTN
eukprot:scaffold158_cov105-Cylindrotheca_fusiformis.AAC.6